MHSAKKKAGKYNKMSAGCVRTSLTHGFSVHFSIYISTQFSVHVFTHLQNKHFVYVWDTIKVLDFLMSTA